MRFSRSTHLQICLSLETLTSIIRTGLPILVELKDLVNSVTIFLTQMTLRRWFPTQIADFGSHSPVVLNLFLSSDASICFTMAFPPLRNSDHHVVSVCIDSLSYSQRDAAFYHIACDCSHVDWDSLRDHLRDVPWEDILKLGASAAASEFCEWVRVGNDVYIPHRKYQVRPNSSPWFLASCAASMVDRNHVFRLCQKDNSSELKLKFRQASNRSKRAFEAAKLAYANKTKESTTSQKLVSQDFW